MVFDHKAPGNNGSTGEVERADAQIKHIAASPALEMIVMPEIRRFITGLAIGKNHALDLSGFEEEIDCPINRGNRHHPAIFGGALQDLVNRERTFGMGDHVENEFTLAGVSLAKRFHQGKLISVIELIAQVLL